jgi:transposase-like protein
VSGSHFNNHVGYSGNRGRGAAGKIPVFGHGKRFVNGKVYIKGIEGFWSFAKERLMKYHGVNPVKFPLYLKDLEFRYNNRHHDLYDAVVKSICQYSLVDSIQ